MLPFNELPQSVIDELGLYVKFKSPKMLEYAFVDIEPKSKDYNTHLIWHDDASWHIACDIHVFKTSDKFEWCYYSAEQIFTIEAIILKLKLLKSKYIDALKLYKESIQNNRLSKLSKDF